MISQVGILRKFRTNFDSFEDIGLFTEIFFLVTVLPPMLRLLSLPRLMKVLTPRDSRRHKDLDLEKSKDKIVKYTDYVLSHNLWIYKRTCLKRSLVLYHFLRKLGINVHVCFGVRYSENITDRETNRRLEGHAWLLHKGDIFLEKRVGVNKTYRITYCFPDHKT